MKTDGNYVQQQLALLETCDADILRERYRELVCPRVDEQDLGRKFMLHRVAHAVQAAALGGLSESELNLLAFLATKDWRCNPKVKRPGATEKQPRAGTSFVRVYKGKEYKLEVDALGRYIYEGVAYKSPTTVARMITGSHINGKTWWGITKGGSSK